MKNFKTSIGKKKLKKEAKRVKRKKSIVNLSNAINIGIIFNCNNEETYMLVRNFSKNLKEDGKQIKVLAYIDDKKTPTYWLPKENYDYITRKDLNFYNIPKGDSFDSFTNNEFDILISLQESPCFPIDYIVSMSRAKLKVGKNENQADIYDFMINTETTGNLKEYIKQVLHYLNLINSQTI